MNGAPYGHCPHCGAPGIARERRIGGNDRCGKGHDYPSLMAVLAPEHHARVLPNGAEFAPSIVVGYVTEKGGFYATVEDVPTFTSATGNDICAPYVEAVQQLSCDDLDDMRAIWRLAALTFGLSEDESCGALLYPHWTLDADARYKWLDEWILCQPATHTDKSAPLPRFWRLYAVDGAQVLHAPDVKHATAALCAHVWGPK